MPEISVIVPVYRAEDFLRRAVDSVLSQSFPDFELLLIDDGSPDGSGVLCDALAKDDARIRVLHKENGGVSSARNLGMDEAKGRFLAFLDADDWFSPDALETLYSLAVTNEADSAGCAHYKAYPEGAVELEQAALPPGVYGDHEIREGIVYRLLGDRMGKSEEILNGFIWRFLFDAELIHKEGLRFVGAYLEDELFLMEYFCYAKRLAITDAPLYYYLQNPQSVTRNYLPDYMETFTRFMDLKSALVSRFDLQKARPLWRENSNWSGLLIAVGNEYAPGNPKSLREKTASVKAICKRPDMQQAMQAMHPCGLSRNKQIVVNLLTRRMFGALTLLYAVKNRKR